MHAALATKLPGLQRFTMNWPGPVPDGNHAAVPLRRHARLGLRGGRVQRRDRQPEGEAALADLPNFAGAGVTSYSGPSGSAVV